MDCTATQRDTAEILSALKSLGYTVSLTDDERHISVRYIGVGEQPPEARALIDELRANKAEALELLLTQRPLPFLDLDGSLVIPFGADPRFAYWQGGQSIAETEAETLR